ncbi:MAG: hypothetical protein J0I09_03925 [Sphingobacteriia bacterium]|nr:hypothetical protein [Sphingobacteriia bacterium]
MKIKLLIVLVPICFKCLGQEESGGYVIKKIASSSKDNIFSQIKIRAYDVNTKELILPIIRVDGVSFSQCDTSLSTFYLSRRKHVLQVGWLGYVYSDKIRIKTQLSEDYEIRVYLKPYTKPLY